MIHHQFLAIWLVLVAKPAAWVVVGVLSIDTTSTICPKTQPIHGAVCTPPTVTGSVCTYGEICCPGKGGTCVPRTACECFENLSLYPDPFWYCGSAVGNGVLLCPEVCPEVAPTSTERCDIAAEYKCVYGNVCNTTGGEPDSSSLEYEIRCFCNSGTFSCPNACPSVPCPVTQPTPGDSCSAPFNGTCNYGELCCPGEGGKCMSSHTTCFCAYDATIQCEGNWGEPFPCPSVCPELPPMENDPCDIDVVYLCGYGDPVVCNDSSYSSEYEMDCHCLDGNFTCRSHDCPVPCPAIPLVEGAPCSQFVDTYCDSGAFCCPEEGGKCIPEKYCYCGLTIECISRVTYGSFGSLPCPSVCPKTPPARGDACDIDVRFNCGYGDAFICNGTIDSFEYERECYCLEGKFSCINNSCPVNLPSCPEIAPVQGDECSGTFKPNGTFFTSECTYGELCCPGEGGKCIPDQACFCDRETIFCYAATSYASLPCPSVCPPTSPKSNDPCDIDNRYECRYGAPLPCMFLGYSMYREQCYCYDDGTFNCVSNSCPPIACPATKPAHGAISSPFVSGTCNYVQQPCCVQGGGGGVPCVANSTCSCDDLDYTVKCTELPIEYCSSTTNDGTVNSTRGRHHGQMNGIKKVKKPKKVTKKVNGVR
jgi:hypothetical protein